MHTAHKAVLILTLVVAHRAATHKADTLHIIIKATLHRVLAALAHTFTVIVVQTDAQEFA
jgi:hypothetical protein